jgi:hypothetical protein
MAHRLSLIEKHLARIALLFAARSHALHLQLTQRKNLSVELQSSLEKLLVLDGFGVGFVDATSAAGTGVVALVLLVVGAH